MDWIANTKIGLDPTVIYKKLVAYTDKKKKHQKLCAPIPFTVIYMINCTLNFNGKD